MRVYSVSASSRDAERCQAFQRFHAILPRWRGKQSQVGRAPHDDHVGDAERKVSGLRLRHVGDAARDLGPRQLGYRPARETDLPRHRRQQTEQGLEQRGLARAIGTEQADHLARAHLQVDVAADDLAAVAEAE